jgi:multidrug resistance protein, MATE family
MSAASKLQGAAASSGWLKRELGATFALSWPIVLANVAINVMNLTDLMMLGWLSPRALAAGAGLQHLSAALPARQRHRRGALADRRGEDRRRRDW